MGCAQSLPEEEARAKARDVLITREIKRDEQIYAQQVKMLLLGPGESGKTTVLKQMKIIHLKGFGHHEIERYRQQVFRNICVSMQMIVRVLDEESAGKVTLEEEDNERHLDLFRIDIPHLAEGQPYPARYRIAMQALWLEPIARACTLRSAALALPENTLYFYSHLDRLFSPRYAPTEQDILHCRGKTTGIHEIQFKTQHHDYRLFDVGGQRSERRKWLHCFENVTCVIFVASVAAYDQYLLEDQQSNQMTEALMLFEVIANSLWFKSTDMVLLLNKTDLLNTKVLASDVKAFFPSFTGNSRSSQDVRSYFKRQFLDRVHDKKKAVYCHYTSAIDTQLLRVVMSSVMDMIISTNLQAIAF
ncbi:uncharacterized protein L969DRAFT_92602 [Mixia osmundae IAM 14324]|uniref:Uncharacterized protein n=1 Tax=Mixia osmundae (strain CBS 9802 / IAM 14324 / JCM 22182 / KY 12970) TaxID=764103 RepID=G7DY10_MIXOS|nr:uncharacterized protein L969DRAFT_92602 [Mixia osmundae IAM 14324]KEI41370.1 hypothetical protein L969DRAFT_92602 [Mixia osmundae IAM 14324]GAA95470.1 hypothetical protein E5Q_02124 [Mixia osmundae IAM 14324]